MVRPQRSDGEPVEERGYSTYDRTFPGIPWERDKSMEHKVYVLVDPSDNTVRYVGVTTNPRRRRSRHRGLSEGGNRLLTQWKASLHERGLRPLMAVVDSATGDTCGLLEAKWIAYYRRLGRLCNVYASGDGRGREPSHAELDAAVRRATRGKRSHARSALGEAERFLGLRGAAKADNS